MGANTTTILIAGCPKGREEVGGVCRRKEKVIKSFE